MTNPNYGKNILDLPKLECDDDESALIMPRPHSNSRVDRAGAFLAVRSPWPEDDAEWPALIDAELDVFYAWRKLHAHPLETVSKTLTSRAVFIDPSATIAQRLKRFRSIQQKLKNEPRMQLTTMQDIAGCRAVVSTIQQADALMDRYEEAATKRPNAGPELVRKWGKDYIRNPKEDGYRSIHLVLKYRTNTSQFEHCNGLRVEIQIRSRLQHAWATAVETASAVTNQALKSGVGEEDWKHFFRLMGDFIAMREECPLLTTTVENASSLRDELAMLAIKLKIIPLLEGMRHVVERFQGTGEDDYYLLILDSQTRSVNYQGFKESDFVQATEAYGQEERAAKDNQDVNVVLVKVKSIGDLKEAYPSYFLDSTNFVAQVKQLFSTG